MASELALIINTTGNDDVLKIMLPIIKEKFEKNFPEVHIEVHTGEEFVRPEFVGLKQWVEIFRMNWYYIPSDLVDKFRNILKVI